MAEEPQGPQQDTESARCLRVDSPGILTEVHVPTGSQWEGVPAATQPNQVHYAKEAALAPMPFTARQRKS